MVLNQGVAFRNAFWKGRGAAGCRELTGGGEISPQVTGDLFDIMSGQTDVDHPLCEECTDTLLDQLDTQLNITENECQNYK